MTAITWIPIKMAGFCLRNWLNNSKYDRTLILKCMGIEMTVFGPRKFAEQW